MESSVCMFQCKYCDQVGLWQHTDNRPLFVRSYFLVWQDWNREELRLERLSLDSFQLGRNLPDLFLETSYDIASLLIGLSNPHGLLLATVKLQFRMLVKSKLVARQDLPIVTVTLFFSLLCNTNILLLRCVAVCFVNDHLWAKYHLRA